MDTKLHLVSHPICNFFFLKGSLYLPKFSPAMQKKPDVMFNVAQLGIQSDISPVYLLKIFLLLLSSQTLNTETSRKKM